MNVEPAACEKAIAYLDSHLSSLPRALRDEYSVCIGRVVDYRRNLTRYLYRCAEFV